MTRLLLHHYATSPFAEKARALLGFKGLSWTSVTVPSLMPKPDVVALTGGYRKTPFLQIGADLYCDTALIADVLERLAPTPSLHPPEAAGLSRLVAQWADSTLFGAAVGHVLQPAGLQSLFGQAPPDYLKAFLADRAALRGDSPPGMTPPEASAALRLYLAELDARLADGRPFLLGPVPCLADFSVYHCLWFVQGVKAVAGVLDPHPRLLEWLGRVRDFSRPAAEDMQSTEAVALAASSEPAPLELLDEPFLDEERLPPGTRVRISATDYGKEPVEGEFVLSRPNELAVRRTDARAGTVVVHFPRLGFQVREVK